ncbi:MAG: FmdB family zinc ribbon protein [Candidatus Deferrimicrobiaceae bacterium]
MPTYAYLCRGCGRPFELRISIREKEEWKPQCPVCGGVKLEQQLFGFSVGGGGKTPTPGGCCPPGRGGCCG